MPSHFGVLFVTITVDGQTSLHFTYRVAESGEGREEGRGREGGGEGSPEAPGGSGGASV